MLHTYLYPTQPLAVAFDDQCPLCQRAKRISALWRRSESLVVLDSAQRPDDPHLAQVDPQRRLATLHASADGEVVHGFKAVSALLRRTWLGPLMAPGIAVCEATPLGEWVYQQVNTRRKACADDCQ